MRYDNMLWVLIAPAFASYACFAFELCCNFAESWNEHFKELRRGVEMVSRYGGESQENGYRPASVPYRCFYP
jgi:hypothetical protein